MCKYKYEIKNKTQKSKKPIYANNRLPTRFIGAHPFLNISSSFIKL